LGLRRQQVPMVTLICRQPIDHFILANISTISVIEPARASQIEKMLSQFPGGGLGFKSLVSRCHADLNPLQRYLRCQKRNPTIKRADPDSRCDCYLAKVYANSRSMLSVTFKHEIYS
jgi:hypothetical protein